ncbi:polysaccharide deacetylase family protein [Gorillibacterium sp. sgz5001074]|uniref:polysaccharide deacetylase family protein n=1 Tax=Gorillibacterium sp. sgz5001074 TaxID=3446695 RepID=UPI003F671AE8
MTPRIPRLWTVTAAAILAASFLVSGCGREGASSGNSGGASPSPSGASADQSMPAPAADQAEADPSPAAGSGLAPGSSGTQTVPVEPDVGASGADAQREPAAGPPEADRIAYLTFDDGPSGNTESILRILRESGIKATFFVTGKESETDKELYRRIAAEGHKLGNHTYTHDYTKLYKEPGAFMEDVRRLDRFLQETVGQGSDILRFPGGSNTRLGRRKGEPWIMPQLVKRVRAEGYQYFDWNVTSTDAAQAVQPKADIISSVMALARGKERIIVLMHDVTVKKTTVEALPEVIRGLKDMGFRFAALDKQSFTTQFLKSD